MNLGSRRRKESAVTLLEVLMLVAVIAVIAGMLLPTCPPSRVRARRIICVNNLKYVGLAFRIFSADNGNQWPWQVSGTNGTRELVSDPGSVWRHFQFVSNELSSTKLLVCPSDQERRIAANFSGFGANNLSYFLGLLADGAVPQTILAGDRNLTTNGMEVGPGLLLLGTNQNAGFSKKIHNCRGNVLLADGSVQQVTNGRFQDLIVDAAVASTNAIDRLVIP